MAGSLKPTHFHDYGKLSLAFVMFWAYFQFSQYLLIYAANLTEEIPYVLATQPRLAVPGAVPRPVPVRGAVFAAAVARPEALPAASRDAGRLAAGRAADRPVHDGDAGVRRTGHLHVLPASTSAALRALADLAAPIAIGGLWCWMFFTQLRQRPLLPVGDPYLASALESAGGH